ncbi:hypothetical protein KA107_03175 [Candidatus Pacearchaeota archaeon]|nr:hypothetical protein [Candidatus Pacearchaeota archaeon]
MSLAKIRSDVASGIAVGLLIGGIIEYGFNKPRAFENGAFYGVGIGIVYAGINSAIARRNKEKQEKIYGVRTGRITNPSEADKDNLRRLGLEKEIIKAQAAINPDGPLSTTVRDPYTGHPVSGDHQ